MSSGQDAVEGTKSAVNQIFGASEDARKTVNSYADNLLNNNKAKNSTGISKDAEYTGEELQKGINTIGAKVEETVDQHKTAGK